MFSECLRACLDNDTDAAQASHAGTGGRIRGGHAGQASSNDRVRSCQESFLTIQASSTPAEAHYLISSRVASAAWGRASHTTTNYLSRHANENQIEALEHSSRNRNITS